MLGVEVEVGAPLPPIIHAYTHFRITLHPFRCRLLAGEPKPLGCAAVRWVAPAELGGYPFPVTDRKIVLALGVR
jgi:A/G-specific adenine glycosylase